MKRDWKLAAIYIVAAELVGAASSLVTGYVAGYYAALVQPPLSPPGWVFPVVWTALYALMGYAAYRVHITDARDRREGLIGYWVQLALNFLWPIIFFRLGLYWMAAFELVLLAFLVLYTLRKFWACDPLAGKLMLPYLIWLVFALYLNVGTAFLN